MSIILTTLLQIVVGFKGFQEFDKYLFLGSFTCNHIWMLCCIVSVFDIVDVEDTRAIFVNNLESFLNRLKSSLVKLSSDCKNELINAENTISIDIECTE